MESVYLETTIISYLVARPSSDLLVAAHQHTTEEWWANRRHEFEGQGYNMPVICTPEELMGE